MLPSFKLTNMVSVFQLDSNGYFLLSAWLLPPLKLTSCRAIFPPPSSCHLSVSCLCSAGGQLADTSSCRTVAYVITHSSSRWLNLLSSRFLIPRTPDLHPHQDTQCLDTSIFLSAPSQLPSCLLKCHPSSPLGSSSLYFSYPSTPLTRRSHWCWLPSPESFPCSPHKTIHFLPSSQRKWVPPIHGGAWALTFLLSKLSHHFSSSLCLLCHLPKTGFMSSAKKHIPVFPIPLNSAHEKNNPLTEFTHVSHPLTFPPFPLLIHASSGHPICLLSLLTWSL